MTINDFIELLKNQSQSIVALVAIWVAFSQTKNDKRIENYLSLKSEFREMWSKISKFPGETHTLLEKDIKDFRGEDNDEIKLVVFQIIDLFNDVFFYYKETGKDIKKSDWHKKICYVFNQPLFISGFHKHEINFNEEYKAYVENIIKQNEKGKNPISPQLP